VPLESRKASESERSSSKLYLKFAVFMPSSSSSRSSSARTANSVAATALPAAVAPLPPSDTPPFAARPALVHPAVGLVTPAAALARGKEEERDVPGDGTALLPAVPLAAVAPRLGSRADIPAANAATQEAS